MTSLRDVDQPGIICEATYDAASKKAGEGSTARAMNFIRRGSGADLDVPDAAKEKEPRWS
jgi:hypothetical protein